MKKNIAIAVLSLLCIGFFFYGLIQKIEAEKQAQIAIEQTKLSQECKEQAEEQFRAAKRALELAQEQAAIATLRAIEAGKSNK